MKTQDVHNAVIAKMGRYNNTAEALAVLVFIISKILQYLLLNSLLDEEEIRDILS